MKIVERHSVAPPSGSVPSTTLPLSFLDILWLVGKPVQRTFLYKLPSISTPHFLQNILPNLKHSLSLALVHFFPVAGSLVFHWDQPGSRPYIHYEEGYSVALTVGESDKDFNQLVNRDGKLIDDAILCELVPCLSASEVMSNPLFALQMTVFPNRGICIGIAYKHALGDGRSIMHFLKMWSSIRRSSGVMPEEECPLPVLDRSLVPDPGGVLQDILVQQLKSIPPSFFEKVNRPVAAEFNVRATIVIKRCEMENIRQWILSEAEDGEKLHLSSFVSTVSLIWVCLVNSQSAAANGDDDLMCSFGFVIDCCNRYEYHSVVPSTYFGNCLCMGCFVSAKRVELQGESGLIVAVQLVGNAIKETVAKGPTKEAEMWIPNALDTFRSVHDVYGVAGSPRLGSYGLDFGWGKPEKVEVVSIAEPKSISLAESRDDVGGYEVGLVLNQPQMEAFIAILEESKAKYRRHSTAS